MEQQEVVELHQLSSMEPVENGWRVVCFCGARWTINRKEKEAGELKMDYHRKYAKRPKTKPD